MTQLIRHPGVVESTDKQVLRVRIVQTSGCAACRAKGYCSSADVREKLVDVPMADAASYHPGDSVWVMETSSAGRRAACLAFVIPFLLVLFSLALFTIAGLTEVLAAVLSLALLIPYYISLWLCRKRIGRQFIFSITPA